jgi:hypothetical protein
MLNYNTMGACVLVLTLATILVVIPLTLRARRSEKGTGIWFLSGLTGVLLGAGGAVAAVQLMGYELTESYSTSDTDYDFSDEATEDSEYAGGMGGSGMGGSEMGGSEMGGGRWAPSPKRELTTLVRKIDLLTGDIALNLSDDQTTALAEILVRLDTQETMADDDAKAAQGEILAVLDDTQKAKQEAVGLPRSGRGRGGRGGGGGEDEEDANPFNQEENATALQSLLGRLGAETSSQVEPRAEAVEERTEETAPEAN